MFVASGSTSESVSSLEDRGSAVLPSLPKATTPKIVPVEKAYGESSIVTIAGWHILWTLSGKVVTLMVMVMEGIMVALGGGFGGHNEVGSGQSEHDGCGGSHVHNDSAH